jgi:hypothetical protein
MRLYDYLGIVAMIATPLAAAVLFGWQLHSYLLDSGLIPWLAIVGGLSGAVAIESVGIYAGHVGMDYARRRDWRGLVAGAALVFYVGFGWSKVPEYGAIFVIAAFVYVLVALRAEAAQVDGATAVTAKEDRGWAQRMELERERMKHQERLARIEATKVRQVAPETRQDERQDTGKIPADWRQVAAPDRHKLAHMTREERQANMPQLSERAARDWHNRLDEIAAQNGHYAG